MKNLKLSFFSGLFFVSMTSHATIITYVCDSTETESIQNGRSYASAEITLTQVSSTVVKVEEVKKLNVVKNNYEKIFPSPSSPMSAVFELKKSALAMPNVAYKGNNIGFFENQKVMLSASFIFSTNTSNKPYVQSGTLSMGDNQLYRFTAEKCLDNHRSPRGRF